jgi:hypothetical protein
VAGRCIIVLCNIFGVVLLSSMVSAILTLSKPLIAETRMIEFVELKHFDLTVRDSAARIIAMTWRQFKLRQQLNRLGTFQAYHSPIFCFLIISDHFCFSVKQLRFSWLESLKMTTPIRIQLFIVRHSQQKRIFCFAELTYQCAFVLFLQLQRRLCSEMLIFDHARQISVLGSENVRFAYFSSPVLSCIFIIISILFFAQRSDESIIRVRLQKMLANTMSAETRLVNGQREIKYSVRSFFSYLPLHFNFTF